MAAPPIIPALPAAPNRNDAPADFSTKADTFVAALPPMVQGINTSVAFINETAVDASAAIEASATAVAAKDAAVVYAASAKASATAAEGAQGSIGNLALIQAMALLF